MWIEKEDFFSFAKIGTCFFDKVRSRTLHFYEPQEQHYVVANSYHQEISNLNSLPRVIGKVWPMIGHDGIFLAYSIDFLTMFIDIARL